MFDLRSKETIIIILVNAREILSDYATINIYNKHIRTICKFKGKKTDYN